MADPVVVAGAGPAGMAAAWAAAQVGSKVVVLDENRTPGGQIWRGEGEGVWFERLRHPNIDMRFGETVDALSIPAHSALILCTGARERFLPFPGWTLPHVVGAGGLQAMVKGGLAIAGKRVLVAGTGPLLLAVARYLRKRGGRILAVVEQTPRRKLISFARSLTRFSAKLVEAARLQWDLKRVPYWTDCWPTEAEPGSVKLSNGRRMDCDYLACGFGLVPNSELAEMHGCRIDDGAVAVDRWQRTTVPNILCAGEPTGIGGVDLSLLEGQIAGMTAAGEKRIPEHLLVRRDAMRRFAGALNQAFALRDELSHLASPSTVVCRCEDVTLGSIAEHRSWRAAKLQTRCGMGPCQGRVCGPAVSHLLGWTVGGARPPIYPAPVARLLSEAFPEGS